MKLAFLLKLRSPAVLLLALAVLGPGCDDTDGAGPADAASLDAAVTVRDAQSHNDTAPSPGVDAKTDATPTAPSGTLRVEITGLPANTTGFVLVKGADDDARRVLATTDLALPPGTYSVEAFAVNEGGMSFVPDVGGQEVTIGTGGGALARVVYAARAPKVRDNAKVAAADTVAALATVTSTGESSLLSFSSVTPQIAALAVGDVLVIGQTPATPQGFFGRVLAIDGTTVRTGPASIEDVLEDGTLSFNRTFDPSEIVKVTPIDSGVPFQLNVCNSLTVKLPVTKGRLEAALAVTGELCFAPSASMSIQLVPFKVGFSVGANVTSKLEVEASLTASIGIEIPLFTVTYGSFVIWTGPVPWVITPEFTVYVGAEGSIKVGARMGVTAGVSAHGGFVYEKKKFTPHHGYSTSYEFQWPEPIAEAEVRAYAGPKLTFLINGVGGPFIALEGYARFNMYFLPQFLWELRAGVSLLAGLSTSSLLNLKWQATLFNYERLLATSRQPPPEAARLNKYPALKTYQDLAMTSAGTVLVPVDNDLKAVTTGGASVWSHTGEGEMLGASIGPDGSIYARTFRGHVYKLNPTTGARQWRFHEPDTIIRGLAVGDHVYVPAGENVVALDLASGVERWRTPLSNVAGVAVSKAGDTVYAANAGALVALNAATGAERWRRPLAGFGSPGLAPTIGPDGTVYVATINTGTPAHILRTRPDGTTLPNIRTSLFMEEVTPVTVAADGGLYLCGLNFMSGFPPGGSEWRIRFPDGQNCDGAPALDAQGRLYASTGETLLAAQATTGQVVWRQTMGRSGGVDASPLLTDQGRVLVPNGEGLWVFQAGAGPAPAGWQRQGGSNLGTRRAR